MIKESKRLVDQPHSFSAVLRCAFLLILFALGVEIHAQSYNLSESYRISGTTQSTPSVSQGGYGVMGAGNQAFDHGYHVMSGINTQASEYKMYQGAVYEPFGNTTPSESSASSRGISGRRNSDYEGDVDLGEWGDPTTANPGDQSEQSPIGEPWIMLAFAAMAAIAIALRKKQTA